jgi:putative endonuclease
MERQPCVYILASGKHGTLYIGVTSDLMARLYQHREGLIEGFTSRYGVYRLVWFDMADTMEAAITREKQLKKWNRDWKLRLIEDSNPQWWIWRSAWVSRRSHAPSIWISAFAGMTK